jgi:hypothetical protein
VVQATVVDPASDIEIIPASALPPVENVHVEAEAAQPVEIAPDLQLQGAEQAHRKMLGKVKRAFFESWC